MDMLADVAGVPLMSTPCSSKLKPTEDQVIRSTACNPQATPLDRLRQTPGHTLWTSRSLPSDCRQIGPSSLVLLIGRGRWFCLAGIQNKQCGRDQGSGDHSPPNDPYFASNCAPASNGAAFDCNLFVQVNSGDLEAYVKFEGKLNAMTIGYS